MGKQVVVVGAGMGGLSAAIHLRLLGFEVLVLEKSDRVGGKAAAIDQAGYHVDPGPSIIILTRIYEQVFREAGRNMADYLKFRQLDPFSRVILEGNEPIDLPSDTDLCLRVLRSEAPEDEVSFRALLAKLDKVSPLIDRSIFRRPYLQPWQLTDLNLIRTALHFNVRQTYREMVDDMFKSPLLRAFFYGFPSYGGQTYDSKAPGALMIPYLMVREGVWWPEGGVGAIPTAFRRLASELGVEFRVNSEVTEVRKEGNKVTALQTKSGDLIEAETVVSNVDRLQFGNLLGRRSEELPSLSYFTIHWGIRGLVGNLRHHTLTIPTNFTDGFEELYRRRTFPTRPIVYLNATHLTDASTAPPGNSNLFAVVTTPADEPQLGWQDRIPEYRQRVRGELANFGIEFEDSQIEFERIQSPTYFASEHGNYRGSLYGPDEAHRLWGLMPLSNRDSELRNLFYCGGSVQPGAGLPMVTLSGKFAAELVFGCSH